VTDFRHQWNRSQEGGGGNAYSTHSGTRTYKPRFLTVTKATNQVHDRIFADRAQASAVTASHAHRVIGCYRMNCITYITISCCDTTRTYRLLLRHIHVSTVVTSHARIGCCYFTCTDQLLLRHLYFISRCYMTCKYQLLLHHVQRHQLFLNHVLPCRNYCARTQVLSVISSD